MPMLYNNSEIGKVHQEGAHLDKSAIEATLGAVPASVSACVTFLGLHSNSLCHSHTVSVARVSNAVTVQTPMCCFTRQLTVLEYNAVS